MVFNVENPEFGEELFCHQERLNIDVRKPSGLRIDDYLEAHQEIRYNYDFGDEKHPEHESIKAWAKECYFREYDSEWVNMSLKFISYKKTEWDKINHENYKAIENKYMK